MSNPYHDGLAIGRKRYHSRPTKRTVVFKTLPIAIEIEIGETYSGIGEDGKPWSKEYKVPYGEIKSTRALSDGDPVDVYLGPDKRADMIYVIHQLRRDGSYDEDKCMIGFASSGDAVLAYKQHGPTWGFGTMDVMTFDQFVHGYLASNRRI